MPYLRKTGMKSVILKLWKLAGDLMISSSGGHRGLHTDLCSGTSCIMIEIPNRNHSEWKKWKLHRKAITWNECLFPDILKTFHFKPFWYNACAESNFTPFGSIVSKNFQIWWINDENSLTKHKCSMVLFNENTCFPIFVNITLTKFRDCKSKSKISIKGAYQLWPK